MPRRREDIAAFVYGLVDAAEGNDLPPGVLEACLDTALDEGARGLLGRYDDEEVSAVVYGGALDTSVMHEPESVTVGDELLDALVARYAAATGLRLLDLADGTETNPLAGGGPSGAFVGAALPSGCALSTGVGADPWWFGYVSDEAPFSTLDPIHERTHGLHVEQGFDRDTLPTYSWASTTTDPYVPISPFVLTDGGAGTARQLYVPESPIRPPFRRLFLRFSFLLHGGGETALSDAEAVDVVEPYVAQTLGSWDYDDGAGDGVENYTVQTVFVGADGQREVIPLQLNYTIAITDAQIPERAYGIAIYAATAVEADATEPDGLYRLWVEAPFDSSAGWTLNVGDREYSFSITVYTDDGDAEILTYGDYAVVGAGDQYPLLRNVTVLDELTGQFLAMGTGPSYEDRTGVAETTPYGVMRFGACCYHQGFLFVADVDHSVPTGTDTPGLGREPSAIVRGLPYHADAFNWPEDVAALPFQPVALASYEGRVWAFSRSRTARVNPATLQTEEEVDGVGAFGPYAVCEGGGALFVAGPLGAFLVRGGQFEPVSGSAIPTLWRSLAASIEADPGAVVTVGYEPRARAFVVSLKSAADVAGATCLVYYPQGGMNGRGGSAGAWGRWSLEDGASTRAVHALFSWAGRDDDASAFAGLYALTDLGLARIATAATRKAWEATLHGRAAGSPQVPTESRRSYLRLALRAVDGFDLPTTGTYSTDGAVLAALPAAEISSVDDLGGAGETDDRVHELPKGTRARTLQLHFEGAADEALGAASVIYRPVGTA